MTVSWLLFALGLASVLAVLNARRPRRSLLLVLGSWLAAWAVVELAVHLLIAGTLFAVLLVAGGALDHPQGWIGLALWLAAVAATVPHASGALRTKLDIDGRPEDLDLSSDAPRFPRLFILLPLLSPWRAGVRHERGRVFAKVDGRRLRLDIFRPKRTPARPLPAVINVHGGGWVMGSRHEQGLPLLNHLAANGWIGFNIDYRLSPQATLPEHVEDVKRAIGWVREHASELGVDPDFIALTGGSAGGHLTALAALTADDKTLQPGFESADTHVQAAVPFYGLYDLLDTAGHHLRAAKQLFEWIIVKARPDREPDRYRQVSPLYRINEDAPPFLVVHGSADTLIPVAESRTFVERLRAVSRQPVLYAEMKGAQHAFDIVASWRTAPMIEAIERFLATTYAARSGSADTLERRLDAELTA
jgi:acetyl esterase/lipase